MTNDRTKAELDQITALIELAQQNIVELEKQRKALLEAAVPPEQRIAELLHSSLCTANHIDQCGWGYENWERPGSTRRRYLNKATVLLAEYTVEEIVDAFGIVSHARNI